MSYKILASIRFLELQNLDLIETPLFEIVTNAAEKAKVVDTEFRQFAGLRDIQSYEKNAIAYVFYESSDDNEVFLQAMNEELPQRVWQIETFLLFLWFIKDNSISLEQAYGQFTIAKAVNWWTGRNVFSTYNGDFKITIFNDAELKETVDLLLSYTEHCLYIESQRTKSAVKMPAQSGEFRPSVDPYKIQNRIERAMSFLSSARSTPYLPQKIAYYMSILECLFSTDGNEIIHKVSERTAFYLMETQAERIAIYKSVKDAYSVRSKFVHGDKPPKTHEQLCAIALEADNIIRLVLKKVILYDYDAFLQKDLNEYFNRLIF